MYTAHRQSNPAARMLPTFMRSFLAHKRPLVQDVIDFRHNCLRGDGHGLLRMAAELLN